MRWLKIFGTAFLVVIGLFVGLVVYLANSDLSRYRGTIEEAVSEATGRKFEIGGRFDPRFGRTISLVAEDVSLSNTTWGHEPEMIKVDRFAITLDLWSLVSRPIRIHNLEIEGARLLLESEPDKGANWEFVPGKPTEPEAADEGVVALGDIVFEQALVEDLRLTYSDPGRERPLDIRLKRLKVEGTFGDPPNLVGTDVVVEASGTDLSAFSTVLGIELPQGAFDASGRVKRTDEGFGFENVVANLGDFHLKVRGFMGEPPKFVGTNLDFDVSGPSLMPISRAADLPELPDTPFGLRGHFEGTPEAFRLRDFSARLGEGDLRGFFTIDLREKPTLTGEFYSDVLDLSPFFGPEELDAANPEASAQSDASVQQPVTQKKGTEKEKRPVISDEPLPLEHLDEADLDIRLVAKRVITGRARPALLDLNIGFHLEDQRLYLDPLTASGPYGGSINGTVLLEPLGGPEDGAARTARLEIRADLKQVRLGVTLGGRQPEKSPPTDINLTLNGSGASLHSIMSSSNARLEVVQGQGQVANNRIGLAFGDVIMQLFSALNPFSKKEPYTKLECSVTVVNMTDGVAKVQSLVFQTDKLGIIGRGKLDFKTEKIDLDWNTKPREGLGVSTSVVVNPFIKLGGTFAKPALQLNPVRAAGTAGAAVATSGLTLWAKGFWDRVTGELDLCAIALKKASEKPAEGAVETGAKTKKKNES